MRIAIIDSCQLTLGVYTEAITKETGYQVDCFESPVDFIATRVRKYDLVISDFYFDRLTLDHFWLYLDPDNLIILTGDVVENKDLDCLGVFQKNLVHTRKNILSLIKRSGFSLRLVQT